MVHMLKAKAKVKWAQKSRKKYEALKPKLKVSEGPIADFKQAMDNVAKKASEAYQKKEKEEKESAM